MNKREKQEKKESRQLLDLFFGFFMEVQNQLIDHTFTEGWLRQRVLDVREKLKTVGGSG